MGILRAANSWSMNILVAVCVLLLVIGLPLIDRSVCGRLGISLTRGISTNPKAKKLLRWRKFVLYTVFVLYLAANVYLVFMSRTESDTYAVHTDLMADLANSVSFDLGVFGTFEEMLASGFRQGWDHIHVVKAEDIMQVLMNTMFYIPMGYLLPYCFRQFQGKKNRTVFICFLFSFITENIQLIFRRGTYDLDDLFFNTLGGLIGYGLYKTFAYYVTNPGWRRELRGLNRWQRKSHKKPLTPLAQDIRSGRVTLFTEDLGDTSDFYTRVLGFRQADTQRTGENKFPAFLQLGELSLELRVLEKVDFNQQLVIWSENLDRVRKRLEKAGIPVSDFALDACTGHRKLEITAPDDTVIVFTE